MYAPSLPHLIDLSSNGCSATFELQMFAKSIVLLLSVVGIPVCEAADAPQGSADARLATGSGYYVTNVAQLRTLSGADYLDGCDFQLTGVVTLVDTNRDLVVMQDATGAVALNFQWEDPRLQVGELVTLDGTNGCPYFGGFPDYPYFPAGREIQNSFEAPMNWGVYNLTRMRGYLHPKTTGDYRFWIASDNSSELWLSTDANPSKVRQIASVPRYQWTLPHEWSRFPSQRSDSIRLEAGRTYFLEALQEQTTGGENLSVAWEGPGFSKSVIDGSYLTPWNGDRLSREAVVRGALREYWTNYSAGDVSRMAGARPFESALTVKRVAVHTLGQGKLPKPDHVALNQALPAENNYRWVQVEGMVTFKTTGENTVSLELSDGQSLVEVRVEHWIPEMSKQLSQASNVLVRVNGVCEGVYDQNGTMLPGLLWATAENSVSLIKTTNVDLPAMSVGRTGLASTAVNSTRQGWYGIRGVVTFNDRVFGTNHIFVQGDTTAVRVVPEDRGLERHLQVGEWVDLGGGLEPAEYLPVITPLVVQELGWSSMPPPVTRFPGILPPPDLDGKWCEMEGVVHSVSSNGTISVVGKQGPICFWIGHTPTGLLYRFVDAKLRARGVLSLELLDGPVLLIPSPKFVDVEEEPPDDPFNITASSIANLFPEVVESPPPRRVRVVGEITCQEPGWFFLQDASGGIRVQTSAQPAAKVGDTVEVLAFPALNSFVRTLTEPLVRPFGQAAPVSPRDLDLSEGLSAKQSDTLVRVRATLLACKTNGASRVLELQEQQRVFTATLAADHGRLPDIVPGSRLQITGVCDRLAGANPVTGEKPPGAQMLTSPNILLRSPKDLAVLNGPPWWNWKRTTALVGTLFAILMVTLLWVHLLQRRLERQQAAQLAFSRQVLKRLEDERRRIAINLHDSLGQILLAIKNQAVLAAQRAPDEAGLRERLDEISGASSQAIEEVRQVTQGLRPYQLDRLGLTQTIRAVVARAAESGSIQFASRVQDIDGVFDKDSEIHVYRIVQEAVNNVFKHSAATEATVVVKRRPGVVSVSIRDNGRGFEAGTLGSASPSGVGSGLSGIAERVRILNGTLAVDSRPGAGTSLTVEVPLSIHANESGNNSPHRG
jgi:signal transduction histidine kinase